MVQITSENSYHANAIAFWNDFSDLISWTQAKNFHKFIEIFINKIYRFY